MAEEMWAPTLFQIGKPWPWEPEWVAERGFRWLPDSMVLLMVEDDVTEEMCAQMMGPADLAVIANGPLVGILARFGDLWGWAESLVWRRPDQDLPEPLRLDPTQDAHVVFHIVLVDRGTRLVRHMRLFTASSHVTKVLAREVAARWADGTDLAGAQVALVDWEHRYPDIDDGLRGSLARCHGGD